MTTSAKSPKPSRNEMMAQLLDEMADLPGCYLQELGAFAKILKSVSYTHLKS